MTIYYLDTSIWLDYYENRTDGKNKFGEFATKLIKQIIGNSDTVIISDYIINELLFRYDFEDLQYIFEIANTKIIGRVKTNPAQILEASKISDKRRVPLGDAIHAILARDNKAILVSRDQHFYKLKDIAEAKKPEDLI